MPDAPTEPPTEPLDNPPITPGLRVAMAVAVAVVTGGGLLLFLPARTTKWVWTIGPFNSRFLGAVYLSEMVGGLVLVIVARRYPARVVIPVALTFTGVVTLASFIQLGDFDFENNGPWLWFAAYVGFTAFLPAYAWRLGNVPPPAPTSPAWRRLLLADGAVLVAYGLGLLVAPEPLTEFWPWPIDEFHGRIYSAIFLTYGLGSLLLARHAAAIELRAMGISRIVLGGLAILGLVLADDVVGTVDWTATGTVIWTAGFAVLALIGAAMLRERAPAATPAPQR